MGRNDDMKSKFKYYFLLFAFLALMAVILFLFHDFLKEYSEPLMVLITFVYVVATVEICRANIESADANRDQLAESKRQYEDKKRLEIMPYLQFEKIEKTTFPANYELNLVLDSGENRTAHYVLVLRMKNIGIGTAKDIVYTYQWDNCTQSHDRGSFPVQALSSNESQVIKIVFAHQVGTPDNREACFILRYRDLLENKYVQHFSLKFNCVSSMALNLTELSISSPTLEAN